MARSKRKSGCGTLLLLIICAAAVFLFARQTLNQKENTLLDNYQVKVARFDLKKERLRLTPVLAEGETENFHDMVHRLKPVGAINGTFFDSSNRVLGDVVIKGKLVRRGGQKHAICVNKNREIRFLHRRNRQFDWSGAEAGLASGPRLVRHGEISLDPVADGFKPASKNVRAWRSAVGVDKDGKLIFVVVEQAVTLDELANIMLALDAWHAINLDGGSTTALYAKGKVLVSPAVEMTNILIVQRD